jgi:hypothetical protein
MEVLRARFSFDKMAPLELYLGPSTKDKINSGSVPSWDAEEEWLWVRAYLTPLVEFVREAAEQGRATMVYLC